jgi:glucose-6-phosphate 1-epimerase
MSGAASVERVKDRATGLDKFVLREARGSSVEVVRQTLLSG